MIGIGALIVWLFRFWLPESPRYLATSRTRQGSTRRSCAHGYSSPKGTADDQRGERHPQ